MRGKKKTSPKDPPSSSVSVSLQQQKEIYAALINFSTSEESQIQAIASAIRLNQEDALPPTVSSERLAKAKEKMKEEKE